MSDEKDTKNNAPENLTDEQLAGVTGAGKFSALRDGAGSVSGNGTVMSPRGFSSNDTIVGISRGGERSSVKGSDKLKR